LLPADKRYLVSPGAGSNTITTGSIAAIESPDTSENALADPAPTESEPALSALAVILALTALVALAIVFVA
jgi:hypothetical protein